MSDANQLHAVGEAAHTPTPWYLESGTTLDDESGGWLWDKKHGTPIATTFTYLVGVGTAQANAAFIVEACNSHASLTAELATAHGEIETWKGCHDRAVAKEAKLTAENKALREALMSVKARSFPGCVEIIDKVLAACDDTNTEAAQ